MHAWSQQCTEGKGVASALGVALALWFHLDQVELDAGLALEARGGVRLGLVAVVGRAGRRIVHHDELCVRFGTRCGLESVLGLGLGLVRQDER